MVRMKYRAISAKPFGRACASSIKKILGSIAEKLEEGSSTVRMFKSKCAANECGCLIGRSIRGVRSLRCQTGGSHKT